MQSLRMLRIVLIILVFSLGIEAAHAEIYVYSVAAEDASDTDDEIRLSNMPNSAEYKMLIADEPAIMPTASTISRPAVENQPTTSQLPFDTAVHAGAKASSLEPALIHAVIAVESGHNPKALSPRGARGLMQLMPATAQRFQVRDPYDPGQNILGGAKYLRELHDLFNGDLTLMLAAYNAGPNAILRYGKKVPPYAETRDYVPKVMRLYRLLSQSSM